MKKKLEKWKKPKITQLGIIKTAGGNSNHSEGYTKPNGQLDPGRSFGGASS